MRHITILKICLSFFLVNSIFLAHSQTASTVTISGSSSTNTISNNTATAVDNTIVVNANGNITDFTVSITDSYTSGDVLSYTGSLPSGISFTSFNTTSRSIVFSGTTSAANWQDLLRRVTLQTTSAVCNPESRKINFTVGNTFYNSFNGHYYRHYPTTTTWANAKTNAESQSYFGMLGYLATITSQAENSFISKIVGSNSWIGCTDRYSYINTAVGYTKYSASNPNGYSNIGNYDGNQNGNSEGYWHWVTGPEIGTQILTGNSVNVGGTSYHIGGAVSGVYNNFQSGEPNDTRGGGSGNYGDEDYGHIYTGSGQWNDFYNTNNIGSIIEFGGMPSDNVGNSILTFTKNIYINGAPSGSISGGNITVCSGTNSTTLALTGMPSGSSVSYWESSLDNFLTAGTSITSTSSSITVSNISTTTYYRAVVNTGSPSFCTGLYTSSTPIFVNSIVAGNIVAENNTICPNGIARFTLNGNNANVSKWQISTSSTFANSITDISNTSTTLSYTTSGSGPFYFRAVVTNSTCNTSANTNIFKITISSGTNPVGGSITNTEHCGGSSNSGTLTLSAYTGSIEKWQYSTDGGIIWNDVPSSTSNTLTYTGVGANRAYRAKITNGTCGSTYSGLGYVTVYGTTVWKWNGGTSSDYSTATNWCPTSIPPAGADILIGSSASNNLTLNSNVTIGSINFNGANKTVDLNSYNLTLNSISNANSSNFFVLGSGGNLINTLQNTDSTAYPIGISSTSYTPITIVNKTGISDKFSVNMSNEVLTMGTSGNIVNMDHVKRTWKVVSTNGTSNLGSGINIYFTWNSGDVTGTITNPKLNTFNTSTNKWEIATTGTSTAVSSTVAKHIGLKSSLGQFSIGNGTVPLPLNILNFNVVKVSEVIQLDWMASNNDEISYFEVLRSNDGENWFSLNKVKSNNNLNQISNYRFLDLSANLNTYYYKIKQVNINGSYFYSDIRSVNFDQSNQLIVYPNPSSDGIINLIKPGPFSFKLCDIFGRIVFEGNSVNDAKIQNLQTGIYYVVVFEDKHSESIKLIVQ